MKKEYLLPVIAWLGGVAGFALRRWELAMAYDPELKLMHSCPATWLLWGLMTALLILFAVCCRGMGKDRRDPRSWFYAPSTGYILLVVCAAFVLIAAGLVGLRQQSGYAQKNGMLLLTWFLCLLGGVAVLLAGQNTYRGRWSKQAPLPHMGPSFAALVWLVASYQDHARQPETGLFVWQILSGVAVVLALYGLATLAVAKGGAGWTCTFALWAISLSLTTQADGCDPAFLLMYLFALVYLTAQSWMLLRAAVGQPWSERMCPNEDDPLDTEE